MNKSMYQCLWFFRKVKRKLTGQKITLKKYGRNAIIDTQEANRLIKEKIESGEPFMAARFGSVELNTIVRNEHKILIDPKSQEAFEMLVSNAGFFPKDGRFLPEYCKVMFDSCKEADLLGVWSNEMEDYIVEKYCADAQLCRLRSLEPWCSEEPWSAALNGKKVVVIHPFEKTIINQYTKNRENIFKNKEVLPQFERLYTVKAVQTIAGEKDERFSNWFEALEWMYEEAMKYDFDVALIGCGAYGFPLASMLKKSGKQAIHMGGVTQLLFGIKGKRWDNMEYMSRIYNDSWVRPDEEEQPKRRNLIEEGCYW